MSKKFNDFIRNHAVQQRAALIPAAPATTTTVAPTRQALANEVVVDLDYIISERPSIKIVRDFFRANLATIRSDEEKMFDKQGD